MALVYLAGPISGLSYDEAVDWRVHAIEHLREHGHVGLDPMRHKAYLREVTHIDDAYEGHVLSSQRGIFYRDRFDCTRADLLIVNMLDARRVSIGTVMEVAWADSRDIPIVLAMEREGNLHEHSMLREACNFRVESLEDALVTAVSVLG